MGFEFQAIIRLTKVDSMREFAHMKKMLNLESLQSAMEKAGLSQSVISNKLGVTREATSKWFSGTNFPRPDKLLRLALLLDLKPDELVTKSDDSLEPVVAFRKRGSAKTTALHVSRAKDMGRMLTSLVSYLPYDLLVQPATLKNPNTEYKYVQDIATKVRSEIGLGEEDELNFAHLIKKFNDLQAVIVPTLWGKKDRHENALHIYLPKSMTTWVYLNLDVEVHDFKFWMSHELGHVFAPELRGNDAEDFADAFAGALLFPESLAKKAYLDITRSKTDKSKLNKIEKYAECFSISLVSVYYEINKYAKHYKKPELNIDNYLFARNTNFNKKYKTLDEIIFDDKKPEAKFYIQACNEVFDTPFFSALKSYLLESKKSAGYIQTILDIPLIDAKGIHAELS